MVDKLDEMVGQFPVRGASVSTDLDGHDVTVLTDSRGRFSVPNSFRIPHQIILEMHPEGPNNLEFPINVPFIYLFSTPVTIFHNRTTNKYELSGVNNILMGWLNYFQNTSGILELPVYAESNKNLNHNFEIANTPDNVESELQAALAFVCGLSKDTINLNMSLRKDLHLSPTKLSYLYARFEKNFNISISDDIWSKADTVDDILKLVRTAYFKNKPLVSYQQNNFNKLAEMREKAKSTIPLPIIDQLDRARLYRNSKQFSKSISLLRTITNAYPKFYLAWYEFALTSYTGNQPKYIEHAFKTATRLEHIQNINHSDIHNIYGSYLFSKGEVKEAIREFKTAIKIDPNHELAQKFLKETINSLELEHHLKYDLIKNESPHQ